MIKNKDEIIANAVKLARDSEFKATAIKVELEAHFNRVGDVGCDECVGGYSDCEECYGDWQGASECEECRGYGYYRIVDNETEYCAEDVEGATECDHCSGDGMQSCNNCEEGATLCHNCNDGDGPKYNSDTACHNYIMSKLAQIGLAEGCDSYRLNHGHADSVYKPIRALKYAEFYTDGSVDSEFTFTISLANKDNIYLIPKIVDIFKQLGEEIGNGINVSRAGMHMALLNHPDCLYGYNYSTSTAGQRTRYDNFRRSMTLLLPALFFLASGNDKSRQMNFRLPRVDTTDNGHDGKYSAINYTYGALEFRAFETCYDKPDQVLDNFVVMANCLKYWTREYKPSGIEKIAKSITFGNDNSDNLSRLYCTVEHLDLLNAGLLKLKPAYLTIKDCKAQRNFKTDKGVIKRQVKTVTEQAKTEYLEYEERFNWHLIVKQKQYEGEFFAREMARREGHLLETSLDEITQEINVKVGRAIDDEKAKKKQLGQYVDDKVNRYFIDNRGRWELAI